MFSGFSFPGVHRLIAACHASYFSFVFDLLMKKSAGLPILSVQAANKESSVASTVLASRLTNSCKVLKIVYLASQLRNNNPTSL